MDQTHMKLRLRLRTILQGSESLEEALEHLIDLLQRAAERAESSALGFTGDPAALYEAFGLDCPREHWLMPRARRPGDGLLSDEECDHFVRAISKTPGILLRPMTRWERIKRRLCPKKYADKIKFTRSWEDEDNEF
jgi:hypothetical protein